MSELVELDAAQAAAAVRNGGCSSEELVKACLERIALLEPTVHAFTHLEPEEALRQARRCDVGRTLPIGPLHGVPVAVKEVFDVRGMRCAWGSPVHRDRVPSRDSAAVERLRAAGAIVVGTTVSTEYAIAAAGPTTNPHDPRRTPGGSSSGSAAAVAARMVPMALASQSIGSIVRPATYCGVFGVKPTKGAVSTFGAMPLSGFLDHPGAIARSAADIALSCQVLFGHDSRDPHSIRVPAPETGLPIEPLRVLRAEGPLRERVMAPSLAALSRATEALAAGGARVESLVLPTDFENVEECVFTILCHDMAINHGADRDRAGDRMSDRLRELIDRGRATTALAYGRVIEQAEIYRQYLVSRLEGCSVIVAPATDSVAPPLEEGTGSPLLQGLWTLTGLPVLAVPCGYSDSLPIGVQLIAAPGREDLLLAAASILGAQPQPSGTADMQP